MSSPALEMEQPEVSKAMQRVLNTFDRPNELDLEGLDLSITEEQINYLTTDEDTRIPKSLQFVEALEGATPGVYAQQMVALLPPEQNELLHYFTHRLWLPDEFGKHYRLGGRFLQATRLPSLNTLKGLNGPPVLTPEELFPMHLLGELGLHVKFVGRGLRGLVGGTALRNEHSTLQGGYVPIKATFERAKLTEYARGVGEVMSHESSHDNFYLQYTREAWDDLDAAGKRFVRFLLDHFGSLLGESVYSMEVVSQVMHELMPNKRKAMDMATNVGQRVMQVTGRASTITGIIRQYEKGWEAANRGDASHSVVSSANRRLHLGAQIAGQHWNGLIHGGVDSASGQQ